MQTTNAHLLSLYFGSSIHHCIIFGFCVDEIPVGIQSNPRIDIESRWRFAAQQ